jgi:hypothetical protein
MTQPMTDAGAQTRRPIGAMILSFFGTVWLGGACLQAWPARDAMRTAALTAVAMTGVALFLAALRRWRAARALPAAAPDPVEERRRARQFHLINAGQWIAALVAVNVLNNLGLGNWDLPAVIGIVGIHFLALAPVFREPRHYVLGAILILAALMCPLLGTGPLLAAAPAVVGLSMWTLVLWPRSGTCA